MSVDLNWETLTGGPEGQARAERIRSFIHDKFQSVPFPKFIKSVQVHSFSFGTVAPDLEIKEICDPYPEFYEQDDEDMSDTDSVEGHTEEYLLKLERELRRRERKQETQDANNVATPTSRTSSQPPPYSVGDGPRLGPPFRPHIPSAIPDSFPGRVGVTGVATPLFSPIPSGSSNLHYFHSALSSGFSSQRNTPQPQRGARMSTASSSLSLNSSDSLSAGLLPAGLGQVQQAGPTTPTRNPRLSSPASPTDMRRPFPDDEEPPEAPVPRLYEPRDEDTQIVARVRYSGNVRLELTAELLFEYPVSSFVALPVRLVVTGCKFDGLACVAYIRRRAHFCFLDEDPEVAEAGGVGKAPVAGGGRSLLKEISVESEIGEKGKGKQVLKNVGKVERFVLDQVRRIFEEEFVFPSSWTFLV